MSSGLRTVIIVLALLAQADRARAQFDRTALVINTPTADVLEAGTLAGSIGVTFPLPLPDAANNPGREPGAALRFAPFNRLELALTAYTTRDFALGASYRLLGEDRLQAPVASRWGDREVVWQDVHEDLGPALAVGVHDIGRHGFISPLGHGDDAWPDWMQEHRQEERYSAFLVATVPLAGVSRAHVGLGRGRYVGYGYGRYVNSDIFFDEPNWWAFGLFGGLELSLARFLALGFDFDGRDVNAGLKVQAGGLTVGLAATKLEGLMPEAPEDRFGRVALSVGYRLEDLYRRRPRRPKPGAAAPEVIAEPTPQPPEAQEPGAPVLRPVYFEFNRYDILLKEGGVLKRNAEAIQEWSRTGRKVKVVVEGHCCPIGTEAYNISLSWQRAESVRRHLITLGVDGAMLVSESFGSQRLVASDPEKYHLNRRCEFRFRE